MGKIWTVCSGSGGVGKSMIALALAAGAAKAKKRTILLDASGISRSSDMILGMESVIVLDMTDVASRQVEISSVLYPVPRYEGLSIVCSSLRGDMISSELSSMILVLHSMCDILIIDLPTGQADLGMGIMHAGDNQLVVVRPDDVSIRAAERLLAAAEQGGATPCVVINRTAKERIRRGIQHTREAVEATLDCVVSAVIPEDASIPLCEHKGRAAIECDGPAWTALKGLLESLLSAS